MKSKKKKKGFIFMTVLMLSLMVVSVTTAVLTINLAHARDVGNDGIKNQAYYISNAGLELVYAALNTVDSTLGATILQSTRIKGPGDDALSGNKRRFILYNASEQDNGKRGLIDSQTLQIKAPDGTLKGTADVSGDLCVKKVTITKADGTTEIRRDLYYKILSVGKVEGAADSPTGTHTLTMFVFVNDSNNPKIFSGNKNTPD